MCLSVMVLSLSGGIFPQPIRCFTNRLGVCEIPQYNNERTAQMVLNSQKFAAISTEPLLTQRVFKDPTHTSEEANLCLHMY